MTYVNYAILGAQVCGYLWDKNPKYKLPHRRPALIVCPGGAYEFITQKEADAPAFEYLTMGYQVFTVKYACKEEAANLSPLKQLAEVVRFLRAHCDEFSIDKDKIAVMGFSAGGHLAASLGTYWQKTSWGLGNECKPNALILCYPVISTKEYTQIDTAQWVSGGDKKVLDIMNLQDHITENYPPTFIWAGGEDSLVPTENSLMLAAKLRQNGVPFELHLFATGEHGTSVCTYEVESPDEICRQWVSLSKNWVNKLFDFVP